jgi:hypothetical protein
VQDLGLWIDDHDRLRLLSFLAGSLHRLHRMGIAIGDLSPKNLLWQTANRPACFFIDCDAMRFAGSSALPQAETPDWVLPPGEELGTAPGDCYKLGLLAIRLFNRSQSSLEPGPLNAISPTLGSLARLSGSIDPAQRPRPVAWLEALNSAIHHTPPVARPQPTVQPFTFSTPTMTGNAFAGAQAGFPANPPYGASSAPPYVPRASPQIAVAPAPPRRPRNVVARHLGGILSAIAVTSVLAGVSVWGTVALRHKDDAGNSTSTSGGYYPSDPYYSPATAPTTEETESAATTPATSASPTAAGAVEIDSSITTDPRAASVASMFDTYFEGIDSKNYSQALDEYDPSGVVNPSSSKQAAEFDHNVSTSNDTNVVLLDIEPAGGTATTAHLTFQSTQSAGFGPGNDPSQTCTDWDLTYKLSTSSTGDYLILGTQSASYSAC